MVLTGNDDAPNPTSPKTSKAQRIKGEKVWLEQQYVVTKLVFFFDFLVAVPFCGSVGGLFLFKASAECLFGGKRDTFLSQFFATLYFQTSRS